MEQEPTKTGIDKIIQEAESTSRPLGCRCPSCGLTIENTEGTACNKRICPTCKVAMESADFTKRIG